VHELLNIGEVFYFLAVYHLQQQLLEAPAIRRLHTIPNSAVSTIVDGEEIHVGEKRRGNTGGHKNSTVQLNLLSGL
jgi:hypothetical protein